MPDWESIIGQREDLVTRSGEDDADPRPFWNRCGRQWVRLLRASLGSDYLGYESANFWLVSSQTDRINRGLVRWAEETRLKVLKTLDLDVTPHLPGKVPMLVFHDIDTYYDYTAAHLPDGEHAPSGGMYLNYGYGHFVFPYLQMDQARAVLAHELSHAMVNHLRLPLWLDEGIAQLCQEAVTGRDLTPYEEIKDRLSGFWNGETIQDFWSGRSFGQAGDAQLLSYHLAKVMTRGLARDPGLFRGFYREARATDAGGEALRTHYAFSLCELAAECLGPGDWTPRAKNDGPRGGRQTNAPA